MSVIPKIKIGRPDKRSKINLSFDCSTTSNIGAVQPTMCREMVPNETFNVKVSSLVRLASMPRPTFGRISLRHYHCFVPYSSLWEPFTAMLSGQRFTDNTTSWIPTAIPNMNLAPFADLILQYSEITLAPTYDLGNPVLIEGETPEALEESRLAAKAIFDGLFNANHKFFGSDQLTANVILNHKWGANNASDAKGGINFGEYVYNPKQNAVFDFNRNIQGEGQENNAIYYRPGMTPITPEGADFIVYLGTPDGIADAPYYSALVKLKPVAKHFRSILIGLGYQLDFYNLDVPYSPLKILAFYKAWFNLFSPIREKSFTDTNCYKVIKKISSYGQANLGLGNDATWVAFLSDLALNTYYYLPMDYFSMAITTPQQPNSDLTGGFSMGSVFYHDNVERSGSVKSDASGVEIMAQNGAYQSPLIQKIAFRLLTFANKNTVVGRSVRDYIKTHYGIYEDEAPDSLEVIRVGASRVNIDISDIMSTAANAEGQLGEYGGRGIGYRESEKFDFTAKEFGCWITLSVIVPESGYYQGYLLENRHLDRYHFFMPEFDALGYQVLERGELKADWNVGKYNGGSTEAFGLVPRYSEYKVGRNIVNGDLSLPGMSNSMAPYTLDRRIPSYLMKVSNEGGLHVVPPATLLPVVYDGFRVIDQTDHLGQYNRIFNVTSNDVDHFIIHNVFDVDAKAPMKSLATSFDADSNDGDVMEVSHS